MTEHNNLLQDRPWAGVQVSMCSSSNRDEQISHKNWDAASFVTAKNMRNVMTEQFRMDHKVAKGISQFVAKMILPQTHIGCIYHSGQQLTWEIDHF